MSSKRKRIIAIVLSAVLFALLFAGCGPQSNGQQNEPPPGLDSSSNNSSADTNSEQKDQDKKIVTVSLCVQPITLNPHLDTRVWIWYYTDPMMGYLTNLDETGSAIVPYLAESWTYNDDNTELTFNLRENIYFHNDRHMTAEDVVWTMEYVLDESSGSRWYSKFQPYVDRVEAVSDYEVTFYLKEPNAGILENLAYCPILPQECIDTMAEFPVGCGPFKFVSWEKDQQIVMEKYDKYFEAESIQIDGLIMRTFSEYNSELAAFLAGETQVITQLNNTDLPTIQSQSDKYHTSVSEGNKYFINWNMGTEIAKNDKLREAVKYGVDRSQIVAAAFAGNSYETWQFPATTSSWYIPELEWDTDVERAKKCVAESGYDGSPIQFIVPNTTAEGGIGTVVMEQLTNIGLTIEMQKLESASFMETWGNGQYELAICGFGASLDPSNLFTSYTSDYPTCITRYQYSNPEYDALVFEANRLSNDAERFELYKQAMILFADDAMLNMLISETTTSGVSNRIDGYVYKNGGRPDYTHIYFVEP